MRTTSSFKKKIDAEEQTQADTMKNYVVYKTEEVWSPETYLVDYITCIASAISPPDDDLVTASSDDKISLQTESLSHNDGIK